VLWISWSMNALSVTERGPLMNTITQNFSFCVRLIRKSIGIFDVKIRQHSYFRPSQAAEAVPPQAVLESLLCSIP